MQDLLLGKTMHFHSFALAGSLTAARWRALLKQATAAIGMDAVGKPAEWSYPLPNGHGGRGRTVVQPITESFLALDTWPDHSGAYLIVCSCRPFDVKLLKVVLKKYELYITGEVGHVLRLRDGNETIVAARQVM